jgi:hypothetical protein
MEAQIAHEDLLSLRVREPEAEANYIGYLLYFSLSAYPVNLASLASGPKGTFIVEGEPLRMVQPFGKDRHPLARDDRIDGLRKELHR